MLKFTMALALCTVAALVSAEPVTDVLRASMKDKNQATLARVEQDDVQRFCSKPRSEPGDLDTMNAIRAKSMAAVKHPADGKYLGDWQAGAEVANNGRGLQYSDDPSAPNEAIATLVTSLTLGKSPTARLAPRLPIMG